eukprot:gene9597-1821_t
MVSCLPHQGQLFASSSCLFILSLFLWFSAFSSAHSSKQHLPGLYDDDVHVARLDDGALDAALYIKPESRNSFWLVEFYASWCGHCQNFATVWRTLAARLNTWKKFVSVGAINCGSSGNLETCRHYNITGYPTIILFTPSNGQSHRQSHPIRQGTAAEMEKQVAQYISKQLQDHPFLQQISDNTKTIIAVIDETMDYIGLRLSLHLWETDAVRVVLIQSDTATQKVISSPCNVLERNGKINSHTEAIVPFLVIDHGVGRASVDCSSEGEISTGLDHNKDIIQHVLHAIAARVDIEVPRMSLVDNKQHDGGANDLYVQNEVIQDKNQISIHHPHPVDIMMTLQHMYAVEVAAHDRLGSEEVSIMKALSRAITLIPLPASTITNVNGIRSWLQTRKFVTQRAWESLIEHHPLSTGTQQTWRYCRGSSPQYRGYPCGLWTLFHTLLAHTTDRDKEEGAQKLLVVIADHFLSMYNSADTFMSGLPKNIESGRAMLWLWDAHNRANVRLARNVADISTDPKHPKLLFPTRVQCPKCFVKGSEESFDSTQWNYIEILGFLQEFYGSLENIRPEKFVLKEPNEHQSPKPTDGVGLKPRLRYIEGRIDDQSLSEADEKPTTDAPFRILLFLYVSVIFVVAGFIIWIGVIRARHASVTLTKMTKQV